MRLKSTKLNQSRLLIELYRPTISLDDKCTSFEGKIESDWLTGDGEHKFKLHLKGAEGSRGGVIEIAQIPAMTKEFTLMNVLLVMLGTIIGQIPWLLQLFLGNGN